MEQLPATVCVKRRHAALRYAKQGAQSIFDAVRELTRKVNVNHDKKVSRNKEDPLKVKSLLGGMLRIEAKTERTLSDFQNKGKAAKLLQYRSLPSEWCRKRT